MQNNRHFIFIEIKLLAVEFLKGILFLAIQVDALTVILIASLFAANDAQVFDIAERRLSTSTLALPAGLQVLIFLQRLR